MRYYLIKESGSNLYSNDDNQYLILDGQWEKGIEVVELTKAELEAILKNETSVVLDWNDKGLLEERPNSETYSKLGKKIRKVLNNEKRFCNKN